MMTRHEIKAVIRDLQSFSADGINPDQRTQIDAALGLLYEAYAMAVLQERGIDVDISNICGFVKFVNIIPLKASLSSRKAA
ncbi:MAG: hypothetical protein WCO00_03445 [Rhodospirillaceae bacterium]